MSMPTCRFETAAPDEEYVYGACEPGWDFGACHRKPPKGGRRAWKLCPAVPTPSKT